MTLPGETVQAYLDAAARCGAVVTGTTDTFTIDHTADCHAPRACEHDDQVVTYRPQQPGEPDIIPTTAQRIPTGQAPLPAPGTAPTYEEALAAGDKIGAAHAFDPQLMALFCAYNLQTVVGAVAPKLVWEGTHKYRLTTKQLVNLCATDVFAVSDLMWE